MSSIDVVADLAGARVGVVGLGRTGLAVVDVLGAYGARIAVFDTREEALDDVRVGPGGPVVSAVAGSDEAVAAAVGEADLDLLVVSPGVPATGPVLRRAGRTNVAGVGGGVVPYLFCCL